MSAFFCILHIEFRYNIIEGNKMIVGREEMIILEQLQNKSDNYSVS